MKQNLQLILQTLNQKNFTIEGKILELRTLFPLFETFCVNCMPIYGINSSSSNPHYTVSYGNNGQINYFKKHQNPLKNDQLLKELALANSSNKY